MRQSTVEAAREIEQLAAVLQVPKPVAFVAENRVQVNNEFVLAVEADEDGTARGIANRHAERSCHLYKMGAYWGYAIPARMTLAGEASIFGLEIDHHARQAGLPRELWEALIRRTRSNATREELAAETLRLTASVTAHLRSPK